MLWRLSAVSTPLARLRSHLVALTGALLVTLAAPTISAGYPDDTSSARDSVIPSIDPAPIRANIARLAADDFQGRSFRSEEGKRAAQWVQEQLAAAGAKPLVKLADGTESMLVPIGRMPTAAPNVVAWIPPRGANPSGEFLLVTAHFDHLPPKSGAREGEDAIYNGADDNASGVCGMIAVANALKDDTLDVGVVFVGFTGEEAGLVGSRAFVEEETVPVTRIRGVFNMDMISRQPDGAIRLDGGPKGKPLVDLLVRLAPQVPLDMKVDTHPDWLDRSDQGAFLRAGIPAVLFSCEDHEDYHKVSDHADKADAVLAAKVASLVAGAVRVYAREMEPRFDRSPVFANDGTQRRTLRVGRTMPHAPYWKAATRRSPDRGMDAALVELIAKRTGLRMEEKSVPLGSEITALLAGEVDLVANGITMGAVQLGISREHAASDALIAMPSWTTSGVAALVLKDSTVQSAKDLANKRLAVRSGTAAEAWVLLRANESIQAVPSRDPDGTIASKIEKGELDGFLGDLRALESRLARNPSLRVVPLEQERSQLLMRKSDETAAGRILEALRVITDDGTLRALESGEAVKP